jgi:hypothetical protein
LLPCGSRSAIVTMSDPDARPASPIVTHLPRLVSVFVLAAFRASTSVIAPPPVQAKNASRSIS